MYDTYDLQVEGKVVALWRELDKVHVPQEFEILRNNYIYEKIYYKVIYFLNGNNIKLLPYIFPI